MSVHKERVEKFIHENPDIHPVFIHSVEDAIASQERLNELKSGYSRQFGKDD